MYRSFLYADPLKPFGVSYSGATYKYTVLDTSGRRSAAQCTLSVLPCPRWSPSSHHPLTHHSSPNFLTYSPPRSWPTPPNLLPQPPNALLLLRPRAHEQLHREPVRGRYHTRAGALHQHGGRGAEFEGGDSPFGEGGGGVEEGVVFEAGEVDSVSVRLFVGGSGKWGVGGEWGEREKARCANENPTGG